MSTSSSKATARPLHFDSWDSPDKLVTDRAAPTFAQAAKPPAPPKPSACLASAVKPEGLKPSPAIRRVVEAAAALSLRETDHAAPFSKSRGRSHESFHGSAFGSAIAGAGSKSMTGRVTALSQSLGGSSITSSRQEFFEEPFARKAHASVYTGAHAGSGASFDVVKSVRGSHPVKAEYSIRPISSSLGLVEEADSSESSDLVFTRFLKEHFFVGAYPKTVLGYWRQVIVKKFSVGIQLETAAKRLNYHLDLGERREVDGMLVELINRQKLGCVLLRNYQLTSIGGEETTFSHFAFDWPNFGIPSEEDFLVFMNHYQKVIDSIERPVVHLHCIGGKGRSGTFLFSCALAAQRVTDRVIAAQLLAQLRAQRAGLVENEAQEAFAFKMAPLYGLKGAKSAALSERR